MSTEASTSRQQWPRGPTSSNGGDDHDEQEKKRRKITRRALSCTECKRRKTKCSSLGVTPCDSCIKRGKPQDCKWEDDFAVPLPPSIPSTSPSHLSPTSTTTSRPATVSDIAELSAQITHLHQLVQSLSSPSVARSTPLASPPVLTSTATSIPSTTATLPSARNVETAVQSLESLARKFNHENPTPPLSSSSLAPTTNTSTKLVPSRLPAMFDPLCRKEEILNALEELMPSDHSLGALMRAYMEGERHRGWRILHTATFGEEFRKFMMTPRSERLSSTDPAWIALFFAVLNQALPSFTTAEKMLLFPRCEEDELGRLERVFLAASLAALEVARSHGCPQFRAIQTYLIYFPFLFHFGTSYLDTTQCLTFLTLSTSIAQSLSLDQMADDPSKLPDDPAFKEMDPYVAFEVAKRTYGWLVFLDGTTYSKSSLARLEESRARVNATKMPRNLNDADLSDGRKEERAIGVMTDATIPRICSQFADQVRRFSKYTQDGCEMPYEVVMEYDTALRAVLAQLPHPAQVTRLTGEGVDWTHCGAFSSIHNRILRIHRPYMSRSYVDKTFEKSLQISIESATSIIQVQSLLCDTPELRPGFALYWILGAALVLALDLVVCIDTHSPSTAIASRRQRIETALRIFQTDMAKEERLRPTAEHCARVVRAVLVSADARVDSQGVAGLHALVANGYEQSPEHAMTTESSMQTSGGLQDFFADVKNRLDSISPGDATEANLPTQSPSAPQASPLDLSAYQNQMLPDDMFTFDPGFNFDQQFGGAIDGGMPDVMNFGAMDFSAFPWPMWSE